MIISRKKFEKIIDEEVEKAVREEREWHNERSKDKRIIDRFRKMERRIYELEKKAGIVTEEEEIDRRDMRYVDGDF